MRIIIEIGEVEKYRVEYNFSQLLGSLLVKINEQPVKKSLRLVNEPVHEVHVFFIGDKERHEVRIEKERISTFTNRNRVFVDNRLHKVVESN